MTLTQRIITIALCALATMLTRFLPFLLFREDRPTPPFIRYLGKALPLAIFGMLVVYSLKDVDFLRGSRGLPEAAGILATALLHFRKKNMLLSIAGGTAVYMLLIRFVFA